MSLNILMKFLVKKRTEFEILNQQSRIFPHFCQGNVKNSHSLKKFKKHGKFFSFFSTICSFPSFRLKFSPRIFP